jgi:hypothetical protein
MEVNKIKTIWREKKILPRDVITCGGGYVGAAHTVYMWWWLCRRFAVGSTYHPYIRTCIAL